MSEWPYVFAWDRIGWTSAGRKGQHCKVLVRGRMNSCLVEFEDGHRMVTSRNAIRKRAKDEKHGPIAQRLEQQTHNLMPR